MAVPQEVPLRKQRARGRRKRAGDRRRQFGGPHLKKVVRVSLSERFVDAESSASTTPGGGGPMANETTTGCAARYAALPGCVAVTVTSPGDPDTVTTPRSSATGPESSANDTGRPLEAVATSGKGRDRVVTGPGGANEIVCGSRAAKWAMSDLFESMRTVTAGADPVASPVQPAKAMPGPAAADAVAWAPGG